MDTFSNKSWEEYLALAIEQAKEIEQGLMETKS